MNKKIAYITDIHLDEKHPMDYGTDARKNWNRILSDIADKQIDEVIFGGDIGEVASNQYFFESLSNHNLKITLGNHDTFSEARKYYRKDFMYNHAEMYYSYMDGSYKFIFLDSSSDAISTQQMTWLANELKTNERILLFVHHPILKVDTIVDQKYPLKNRDEIVELLIASGQQVTIFCGHYHTEDESARDNIKQYVTLAASYQIKKGTIDVEPQAGFFGYRMINFTEGKMTTELILFDS